MATLHNNLHSSTSHADGFRSLQIFDEAATTHPAWKNQAAGTDGRNDMNNATLLVQKIRQAPWKQQRQWVGLFMLGLVLVAMVSGLYLNVTIRATLAGREIQMLQSDMTDSRLAISDLETSLASLTSVGSMRQRASALGFEPASLDEITYVTVPGYTPRLAVDFSVPGQVKKQNVVILPEYTESLFDWITRKLAQSVTDLGSP